ncbi:caspase family protein [Glycomyces tritici]|uniref:Caspase family protein n=1 Tax=Glycomyces tritici TaxID=2665176 RepID=A0ABT7YM12_9ACTN|nr:caspase family protein [Glycomyces tritici]MDN3239679.1 caspase family protein [Glycomyces tritici]
MGARRALLIGTADYEDGRLRPLKAPLNDLDALSAVLADPEIGGYEVAELREQPVHLIERAVQKFLVHSEPDDELLLYFSCHGLKDDEELLYFAGTDTEPEPELLKTHAVPAVDVSGYLEAAEARRKVLLLDCCFSGAFRAGAKSADPRLDIGGTFTESGTVVISASDRFQQAFELVSPTDPKPLSVFTDAAVRGLRSGDADLDGDGFVSADDLYKYVTKALHEAGSAQRPTRSVLSGVGDLKLTRQRNPPKQVPKPPAPPAAPRPKFDAAGLRRALLEAPATVEVVVDPADDDPALARIAKKLPRTRGEHLIGYVDQGSYMSWFQGLVPTGRRYLGFVVFTESAVHLPGGERLTYTELGGHEISAQRQTHIGHPRQGGSYETVHVTLRHPYRAIDFGGGDLRQLEGLAALLTTLGRLATESG